MRLFFERRRLRKQLRAFAPLSDGAREGDRVEIRGWVRALDELVHAPLSGRACVAYLARARATPAGDLGIRQPQIRPFVIEREEQAGRIVVDGEHALIGVAPRPYERDPDRERMFFVRHGMREAHTHSGVDEFVVEPGTRVRVGGTLVLVLRELPPTGELGFRDAPPVEQQLFGNRDTPLLIVARRS
jgi:hypothetical protein